MLRGAHDQHVGGFGVSDSGAIREDEDLLVCGVELRRRAFEVEDSYIAAVGLALRRSFQASTLKVSLGYHDGFIGEGQISYAGPMRCFVPNSPAMCSRSASAMPVSPSCASILSA